MTEAERTAARRPRRLITHGGALVCSTTGTMTIEAAAGQGEWMAAARGVAPFTGFDRLEPSARRALEAICRSRRYARGTDVLRQSDESHELHLVQQGHVAIHREAAGGGRFLMAVLGPGSGYGDSALAGIRQRQASVRTLDDVEVTVIQREDFEAVRDREPAVDRLLVELMSWQVSFLMARLTEALEVPADRRVLRRVVELSDAFRVGNGPAVIPLAQDDLASLAGVTRPTANRVLQQASHQGLLQLGWRRIVVPDPERLAVEAYGEDGTR
jgi:CRP/FNR family transcriptional regulator, cyclic AMP receptor protein